MLDVFCIHIMLYILKSFHSTPFFPVFLCDKYSGFSPFFDGLENSDANNLF